MTKRYYMEKPYYTTEGLVLRNVDNTPTTYYYGTCEVFGDFTDEQLEEIGLIPVTPEAEEAERERNTLRGFESAFDK